MNKHQIYGFVGGLVFTYVLALFLDILYNQ